MLALTISDLVTQDDPVEVVERKGFGHPDTVCEALAETLSRNLCCEYRQRFGRILQHNVDKALLCGGRSSPALGGGLVDAPFDIYLAGRATSQVGTDVIPVLDRHVRIHPLIRSGSQDLRDLFTRSGRTPLANDMSFGKGYAPASALERFRACGGTSHQWARPPA